MAEEEDIIRRITKLIELASNNPFSEEADAARKKADKLMTTHTIESWKIEQAKPKEEREAVSRKQVPVCQCNHHGKEGLMYLISAVAKHCRCRVLHYNFQTNASDVYYYVVLFGFPTDLQYAEMIWLSLTSQLADEMAPKYDKSLSVEENLARLKESGMKWQDIHRIMQPGVPWERKHGVRYTGVYTKYCADTNRPRMYTTPTVFVRSFIQGFCERVDERFREMALERELQEMAEGPGTGLVLLDRKREVDEAYEENTRGAKQMRVKQSRKDSFAHQSGRAAGSRASVTAPGDPGGRRR